MRQPRSQGHTLVETLVVMAIISILMALYLPTLSKAIRKAEEVAVKEGFRQQRIGRMSDSANSAGKDLGPAPGREECREAFRQWVNDVIATEMLYIVETDAEFNAYWQTLINPAASTPLEFSGSGNLLARDEYGDVYELPRVDKFLDDHRTFPIGWEYISTDLLDTSSGTLGTNVAYSDGHIKYVRYPGAFPVTRTVAELSHRFVVEFE
jgi:prepilin-type N-terminal cleavage/methylation domain-containing protein